VGNAESKRGGKNEEIRKDSAKGIGTGGGSGSNNSTIAWVFDDDLKSADPPHRKLSLK
jgi:hypothetical protein